MTSQSKHTVKIQFFVEPRDSLVDAFMPVIFSNFFFGQQAFEQSCTRLIRLICDLYIALSSAFPQSTFIPNYVDICKSPSSSLWVIL